MRALFAFALVLAPAAARADDPAARKLVERAVQAAGWADDGKALRLTWADDGVLTAGGMKLPYKATWAVQTPDKYRFDMTAEFGGQTQAITFVVNGDKAWEAAGGLAREVTGDKLKYARNEAYTFRVTSLAPLLRDDAFKLTAAGEKTVGDRSADGVKVEREGRPPVVLYFDRETGLLAKCETRVRDEFQGWKEVTEEAYYEGWKDAGGFKSFAKLRVVRDGQPLIESKLSDFKIVDAFDPKRFEKP